MYQGIKRFVLFVMILVLIVILVLLAYFGSQDIFATRSKEYIMEKYNYGKFDIFAYKVTEYVYDDNNDCGNLWFKECTYDDNLFKEVIFKTKDNKTITVTEYHDGTFSDNMQND